MEETRSFLGMQTHPLLCIEWSHPRLMHGHARICMEFWKLKSNTLVPMAESFWRRIPQLTYRQIWCLENRNVLHAKLLWFWARSIDPATSHWFHWTIPCELRPLFVIIAMYRRRDGFHFLMCVLWFEVNLWHWVIENRCRLFYLKWRVQCLERDTFNWKVLLCV